MRRHVTCPPTANVSDAPTDYHSLRQRFLLVNVSKTPDIYLTHSKVAVFATLSPKKQPKSDSFSPRRGLGLPTRLSHCEMVCLELDPILLFSQAAATSLCLTSDITMPPSEPPPPALGPPYSPPFIWCFASTLTSMGGASPIPPSPPLQLPSPSSSGTCTCRPRGHHARAFFHKRLTFSQCRLTPPLPCACSSFSPTSAPLPPRHQAPSSTHTQSTFLSSHTN